MLVIVTILIVIMVASRSSKIVKTYGNTKAENKSNALKGTKQKVKEEVFNRQKSHALIRNMVRIGISTISKVRHLWQDDMFCKVKYGGAEMDQLESAEIDKDGKILVRNMEAFRLTQWLERGVFDALEKEYLKSVKFAIQAKHPITDELITVEAYEFTISYESIEGGAATINGFPLRSSEGVKSQARRFLKTLYDFSSTLEDLPEDRSLSIMLKYNDSCPPEYEPEYFHTANAKELDLNSSLTTIKLGSVVTPELNMHMKYTGLDSFDFTELCKVGTSNDILVETENSLRKMSVNTTSILCASAKNARGDDVFVGQVQDEVLEVQDVVNDEYEDTNLNVECSPPSELPLVEQLQQYLIENGECKTADILRNFKFKKSEIENALTKLKKQGSANNPRKGIWKSTEDAAVESSPAPVHHEAPTPAPKSDEQVEPPPAPRKKDKEAEKNKEALEEEPPQPRLKDRIKRGRNAKPPVVDSPIVNSPLINDDDDSQILLSQPREKRRKYSITIDSLHLLKGVNDGFQKNLSPDASQEAVLLFHD